MEYVQMTITDWMDIKAQLDEEFRMQQASFVRAGYLLRKIEETEGYKNDGSNSLAEWAHDRYGLSASTVSKYKKINERFSIGGYSDKLEPQYIGFGFSKLTDMLALPDSDLEQLDPSMKREDIRELKAFNKEVAGAEVDEAPSDFLRFVKLYWEKHSDEAKEIAREKDLSMEQFKEYLMPAGYGQFAGGGLFALLKESVVSYKKAGKGNDFMTEDWETFLEASRPYIEEAGHEEAVEEVPVVETEPAVGQVHRDTQIHDAGRQDKDGGEAAQAPAESREHLKEEENDDSERDSLGVSGDLQTDDTDGADPVLDEADRPGHEDHKEDEDPEGNESGGGSGHAGVDPAQPGRSQNEPGFFESEEVDADEPETWPDPEEPESGLEEIAPAQLMAVKTFAKNLQSAISAGAWKKALSSCQNLEAVLEKIVEVQR